MTHLLTPEEESCLMGCRSYEQYYRLRQSFEEGRCAFCDLDREHNIVEFEDADVLAWSVPEAYRREGIIQQLLIVPKRHVRFPWELTKSEHLSMAAARQHLADRFALAGGMLFTRFGDMRLNAGTVPHLHENIWVPDRTAEVRVPVMKKSEERENNRKRSADFAARYEGGESPY